MSLPTVPNAEFSSISDAPTVSTPFHVHWEAYLQATSQEADPSLRAVTSSARVAEGISRFPRSETMWSPAMQALLSPTTSPSGAPAATSYASPPREGSRGSSWDASTNQGLVEMLLWVHRVPHASHRPRLRRLVYALHRQLRMRRGESQMLISDGRLEAAATAVRLAMLNPNSRYLDVIHQGLWAMEEYARQEYRSHSRAHPVTVRVSQAMDAPLRPTREERQAWDMSHSPVRLRLAPLFRQAMQEPAPVQPPRPVNPQSTILLSDSETETETDTDSEAETDVSSLSLDESQ